MSANKVVKIKANKLKSAALQYADMQWHVIPLHWIEDGKCSCGKDDCGAPGKHPFGKLVKNGQDGATNDHATIKAWWTDYPKCNIGIVLAKTGLCAVDIDPRNGGHETIELLEDKYGKIQSEVMAFTGGGGEHRIFTIPHDIAGLPGTLGAGVDLKYNGYIVVEPSIHISGAEYSWEGSSDPREFCSPSPLPDWIRDLGKVKQSDSSANQQFASRFLTDNQIEDLRSALTVIDPDDRDTWIRVGNALKTCGAAGWNLFLEYSQRSQKFNLADQRRVWHSFKPHSISYESVFHLAQDAGWINMPSVPAAIDIEAIKQVKSSKVNAAITNNFVPGNLIPVPNLQAMADYFSGLSEAPTPAISTAGAIALGSVLTGRIYRSTKANWPSLLMAVSGSSGVGKNYIKVGIERALYKAKLETLVAGDFYTHQAAVYSELKRKPCHICISDEFGENFLEARKNNNANKLTVFKSFKKAYSDADHIYKTESYSNMSGKDVDTSPIVKPSLTLLGITTPLQFFSEIKVAHIESGLMNRFIVVNVPNNEQISHSLQSSDPTDKLLDWMRSVRHMDNMLGKHVCPYNEEPVPIEVAFTTEATNVFSKAQQDQNRIADGLEGEHLDAMPRRWRESAMRMATALAACTNPYHPIITEELAIFAVNYVFGHGQQTIEILKSNCGENEYQSQANAVLAFIASKKEGVQDQELSRKFRSLKRKDRYEILAHLQESEMIFCQKTQSSGNGRGRDSIVWVSL